MNINIDMKTLIAAFLQWEIDCRDGKCMSLEAVAAQSVEQNAQEKANTLLVYLAKAS